MKLGDRVRDKMTGFEGVAVSRTEYLYGCVSIGVQPTGLTDKDGKPKELEYFDEQRLSEESAAVTGGPGDHPPQRSTPPER